MNPYLKDLTKIEFAVTYACTGKCKHCSEGEHTACGECIDPRTAGEAVKKIASAYGIKTVMAFGGEPLLFPEAVYAIMTAAREAGVPHRQVITNGCFSRSAEKMREVAQKLAACGVNDLLLSTDAFHQETLPLATVRHFAEEAVSCGIPVRLQPAWLVSKEDENPYNRETRKVLASFADLSIPVGTGNVIFPEGNALRYLAEYFVAASPENPYREDPYRIGCVSFSPNGDVLGGNVYLQDVAEILENYVPQ